MNRAYSRAGIIARLFNQPLAVTPQTAAIVLGAIGNRLDVSQLFMPMDGRSLALTELEALAAEERTKIEARGRTDREAKGRRAHELMLVHNGVAHVAIRGETVAENGIGPMSGFTGYDGIAAQVQAADNDPQVKGILLDVDSPGGEVSGLFECASILMARRGTKPMRAMIRGLGCSATYSLAACADEVTLHELGFAGSNGVITMHADFSGALEQDGIKVTMFTSGAHKADFNPFEPLPEDVQRKVQASVQKSAARLFAHVALARGLSEDEVISQQAEIYQGDAAVKAGLVDKIMSWQDSMDEFEAAVNDPAARRATAPSGARASKGKTMDPNAQAPAAEQQPVFTQAEHDAALASARSEARAEGVTAERERIGALATIAGVEFGEPLAAAIAEGTDAGAFAVAQASAARDKKAAAVAAAKGEAVSGDALPEGSAAAAAPGAQPESNRGKAYADRKRAAQAGAAG